MSVYDLIRLLTQASWPDAQVLVDQGDHSPVHEVREVMHTIDEDGTPAVRIRT